MHRELQHTEPEILLCSILYYYFIWIGFFLFSVENYFAYVHVKSLNLNPKQTQADRYYYSLKHTKIKMNRVVCTRVGLHQPFVRPYVN